MSIFAQQSHQNIRANVLVDSDGDGINDNVDIDDDNDGIPDIIEGNGIDPLTDGDHDGVPVYLDDDDSNFSIGNVNGVIEPGFDVDNDGIPNFLDNESDGDGIFDSEESGRIAGTVNAQGRLTDPVGSNGLVDILETFPDSGVLTYSIRNTDGALLFSDTIPDFLDKDDDNDNVNTID